jgi:hypothetical protein
MKHHIAVLFHEADRPMLKYYAIPALAETWRRDGYTVTNLFGIRKFIPADLILVHVDLSIVPDEYLAFTKQYPIVLNGAVADIRKSAFSRHLLLNRNDNYQGPVFIKSNLNFAGIPESFRQRKYPFKGSQAGYYIGTGVDKILRSAVRLFSRAPSDYLLLENVCRVPAQWFERKDIVIQRFCPEYEKGFYHVRYYQFLGDRATCERVSSHQPIVKDSSTVKRERVDVHPEIERLRQELNFDYGKFDYVMHEGHPVLLDINKTTGSVKKVTPDIEAMRRHRAAGIYSYFR